MFPSLSDSKQTLMYKIFQFSSTEGWEFTKTIINIPFTPVGYKIDSQLRAAPVVGYLPSCIQRRLME